MFFTFIMAPQMKGLTQFIMDLRAAQDTAEERKRINLEISNIRSKFSGTLNTYQKKKYMCKLLYIHLLGLTEEVKFGFTQAYELMSSSNYSEKQLGYLLVTILLNRGGMSQLSYAQEMIEKTHDHLMRDLRVDNDDFNKLALLFIASNFNFTLSIPLQDSVIITNADSIIELWQEQTEMVYGLCVSPTSSKPVKKKASAALLTMLRLCPSTLATNDNWIPRLLSLIDDSDLSLILSALPLASFLTEYNASHAKAIMPSVAQRLHSLVVDLNCPPEDLYYNIPSPWLVIKLLQLAERYFVSSNSIDTLDSSTIQTLQIVVSRAIQNALNSRGTQTNGTAYSAILFQAVSIVTYLDPSPDALSGAIRALVLLVESPEINNRYLALDTLIKLEARSNMKVSFSDHLQNIFTALQNKDISIRRKCIDLLYVVCDASSYTQIVSHLLDYYPSAESSLKASISVKVALIAEKFATDSTWYVSSMLRSLSLSGPGLSSNARTDGISESVVWERVTQVIVNNEDLSIKACKYIVNLYRKSEGASESDALAKVAAFVLGEFGHKLVELDSTETNHFGIETQFSILYELYFRTNLQTRPMILNAFLKFVNNFPTADFIPDILDLFEAETLSLDLEIQKRANEYLKLATMLLSDKPDDVSFASSLLVPLPPFEGKENKLLKQLGSIALVNKSTSSFNKITSQKDEETGGILPNLEGSNPFATEQSPQKQPLTKDWYGGYRRMLQYDAGIFYEDQFIKLTYKINRSGALYTILFNIINSAAKTADTAITAFTVNDLIYEEDSNYIATITKTPELTIAERSSMEIEVRICDIIENKTGPILLMNYKCSGSFNSLRLKIPVVLLKGLSGTSMNSIDDFKKRWVQIGTLLGPDEGEKSGILTAPHRYNCPFLISTLQRAGFAIVQKTPDDPESNLMITGAGIIRTLKSNYGVLLLLRSTDQEAKQFQVTVRSTGGGLASLVFELLLEILGFQK